MISVHQRQIHMKRCRKEDKQEGKGCSDGCCQQNFYHLYTSVIKEERNYRQD